MRNLSVVCTILALLLVGSGVASAQTYTTPPSTQPAQPAPAQQAAPGQVPSVSGLKAFSAEADFMSLAGYLRYLMHQQTGQWVTYAEAKRVAQQQGAQ